MTGTVFGVLVLILRPSSPSLVERGDMEFVRIQYALARIYYDSALTMQVDTADVLWRLARLDVCMADVSAQDERLAMYRRANAFARRCIRADSTKPEGYTWRAAALGNIAMFEGGATKVKLCSLIKRELDHSLMLNPDDDVAYSILGSFYRALGNVSWIERQLATIFIGELPEGGYDEAEQALRRAIEIAPGIIRHHYELGELFRDQNRDAEALEQFRFIEALPERLAIDRRIKRSAGAAIRDITGN